MAIKTNLSSLKPASERLKANMKLLSGGYSVPTFAQDGVVTVYPWDSEVSAYLQERMEAVSSIEAMFDTLGKVLRAPKEVVNAFVASEVVSVLIFARALTNAQTLEFDAVCTNPKCKHTHRVKLCVPDQLERIGEKPAGYKGVDILELPVSKDVLEVRPLLVNDELSIVTPPPGLSTTAARHLLSIATVNGTRADSQAELTMYYRALEPRDVDTLATFISVNEPKLGTTVTCICDKCGTTFTKELSLDSDFFRPKVN